MPRELEQSVSVITNEAAVSTLLYMLHQYAACKADGKYYQRLSQRIFLHLEDLRMRSDMPALLKDTCDELSDYWLQIADMQISKSLSRSHTPSGSSQCRVGLS